MAHSHATGTVCYTCRRKIKHFCAPNCRRQSAVCLSVAARFTAAQTQGVCRTIATAVSEYIASWTGTGRVRGQVSDYDSSADVSLTMGPGTLANRKDELQLVIDSLRAGALKLPDYIQEMFERASLYFTQIGAHKFPAYKVRQLQELHDLATEVRTLLFTADSNRCKT
jgi:hypothetical protein